jgi:hypothetical protein
VVRSEQQPRLGGVLRSRRGAHEEEQRVRGHVLSRRHVLHDRLRHDLALVAHQHVDPGEAAPEAGLAGAEQDARPVLEQDLLVALAAENLEDVRGHLGALRHAVELGEGLRCRRLAVRRPDHRQVLVRQAQREDDAGDQVRLADLTRDADLDRVGRVGTVCVLRQNESPGAVLPAVETPTEAAAGVPNPWPARRHDVRWGDDVPCHL